jgi:hypothetical protein
MATLPAPIANGSSGERTTLLIAPARKYLPSVLHPFWHSERSAAEPKNLHFAILAKGWESITRRTSVQLSGMALLSALLLLACPAFAGQSDSSKPAPSLPEAPQPQPPTPAVVPPPCQSKETSATGMEATVGQPGTQPVPCSPTNWYERFINGPQVKPLTPKEKARLATHNMLDPFNALLILATSGIAVGADAHSAYGPGMPGYGRYVGVSFTEDLTDEFFGTFLIPSIVHQDPHYHRMPHDRIVRRITHAMTQVLWTQGDNGKGMVNYANLGGFAIDDEFANLYVPGQKTDLRSSVQRYGISMGTAPIENFVIEFMPDVARRIHIRVVLFQWIINQVARTGTNSP